jgi:chaperonin cofactor prefoldin
MTKKKMTANEYIASLPDDRGPLDLEKRIDLLIKENNRLHKEISKLKSDLQSAQNDADNQRAMANIPRY